MCYCYCWKTSTADLQKVKFTKNSKNTHLNGLLAYTADFKIFDDTWEDKRDMTTAPGTAAARTAQKFSSGSGYDEHCETQGFEKRLTK